MADLYVKSLDMINPFVVASSPATQGARNVLKSAKMRPGAIVLRNFGHGSGGGSFIGPDSKAMYGGQMCVHSHAVGRQIKDSISTLEQYCEEVQKIKREMDSDIKLGVSVGHYSDIVAGGNWEKEWARQAKELKLAGADAIELHFNTPGVAVAKDRTFAYHQLLRHSIELMKKTVPDMPIMAKLAIESTDVLTSIRIAEAAGATAAGPTARWKGFYFDLDWRTTQARPGAGYGGTQATPLVCYSIAEARTAGCKIPMYGGGGVFNYEQAARILMSGSQAVQFGALACSGGVGACKKVIADLERFQHGAGRNLERLHDERGQDQSQSYRPDERLGVFPYHGLAKPLDERKLFIHKEGGPLGKVPFNPFGNGGCLFPGLRHERLRRGVRGGALLTMSPLPRRIFYGT